MSLKFYSNIEKLNADDASQYSVVELRKIDSNLWIMSGDLSKN